MAALFLYLLEGIASPAHRERAQDVVRRRTANFARRNFMEPPALATDGFGEFALRSHAKSIL
jgi:hypothetical protein